MAIRFPSADLLDRISGVEAGLRTGRRLSAVGWTGFILTAVSAASAAARDVGTQEPWLAILVVAAVLFLILATITRTWIRESRRPFRYTYSIAAFRQGAASPAAEQLSWLPHDLTERLSERIARLSQSPEGREVAQDYDSAIHVGGQYIVRREEGQPWTIEILPWVSIGAGAAEALGHPVKYEIPSDGAGVSAVEDGSGGPVTLHLPRKDYDKIFERVYFSVATQIYRKIREDVEQKIRLLPPGRLRAAAYYFEAEDYARSNTLDAYDGARDLFRRALELYDPAYRDPPASRAGRVLRRLACWRAASALALRGLLARVWPRFGRRGVLIARSTIGLANMQVYRRMLAGLSGARLNPVFEARPLLGQALDRLAQLPYDVPGRADALFDAYVTRAVVFSQLGSIAAPARDLDEARATLPGRASMDAPYLFARGLLEAQPRTAISLMRQAVEVDPYFEVAQSELAHLTELIWRSRPRFEPEVAKVVFEEYLLVLRLNPGNLAAWSNLGYMHWLLDEASDAMEAFRRGRDYKLIKSDTFVAELDYGMARLAAERGHWIDAYRHYLLAIPAFLTQGKAFLQTGTGAQAYYFDLIGRAMLGRFGLYVRRVRDLAQRGATGDDTVARVRESVMAFVLNDYGEACRHYFLRTGHSRWKDIARKQFEEAARLNPRYVMPTYNLYQLDWDAATSLDLNAIDGDEDVELQERRVDALDRAIEHLDRVAELEPDWIEAQLDRIVVTSYWLPRASAAVDALKASAQEAKDEGKRLKQKRAELRRKSRANWAPTGKLEGDAQRSWKSQLENRRLAIARSEKADDYQQRIAARKDEVRDLLPKLLPHEWLGLSGHLNDAEEVAKVLKKSRRRANRRRWQREFDDIHAEAMLTWARSLAAKAPDLAERLAVEYSACFRSDDDFPMVQLRRELSRANGRNEELENLVADHVEHWLKRDPAAFSALRWLSEVMTPEKRTRHLLGAVEHQGAEAPLCAWAGVQLEDLLPRARPGDVERRWREVGRAYERALDDGQHRVSEVDIADALSDAKIGKARVTWALRPRSERPVEAMRAIGQIDALADQAHPSWRADLLAGFRWREPPLGKHDLQALSAWLDAQHAEASRLGRKATLRDIAAARLELLDVRRRQLLAGSTRSGYTDARAEERVLWVRPILVQASPTLIPAEDELNDEHELLTSLIPAMRLRVLKELGLGLPGVRLQSDPFLPADCYRLLFNETVVAEGKAPRAARFLPGADHARRRLPERAVRDDVLDGWWVVPAELRADVVGETWTSLEYVVRHLERLVRSHIASFAGVVEVQRAVERWEVVTRPDEVAARGDSVAQALPDSETLVRFTQVVRDLLGESVSILDIGKLLEAFSRTELDAREGHTARVEQIRFLLRTWLPGNSDARTVISLPSWIERRVAKAIVGSGQHHVLLLPDDEAEELVDEIRRLLGATPPSEAALLVSRADVRPFVRRLLESELPALTILARRELIGSFDGSAPEMAVARTVGAWT